MTSALVISSAPAGAPDLAADLATVGIHVLGAGLRCNMVRDAIRCGPDVVVCYETQVDPGLFVDMELLAATAARPVIVFTNDPDAEKIERALAAGVHAYVINGYAITRLRALVHVAQARFRHEQQLRGRLADVSNRFEERKLVDRAKGILMRALQVSEEDAFRTLRTASMHSKQRVGQVSQQVIAAAHYADAVNRAGKLRMLSQRLVKLCALRLAGPASELDERQLAESIEQLDANNAALGKRLSKATFGDLLDVVAQSSAQLRALVGATPTVDQLGELDRVAEQVLTQADQLTQHLETAGLVTTLHVINVSGRQRMLSQRFAKQALLGLLLDDDEGLRARDAMADTALEFEQAMKYLKSTPLNAREIRALIETAERAWATLTQAAAQVRSAAGPRALGESSEAELAVFEQLTALYERNMQVLMG
jgi:AmiR/NasT family two-component response regulator